MLLLFSPLYCILHTSILIYQNRDCILNVEATSFAVKEKLPIFVLGGGSNLLVSDLGFQGLVIKNEILGIEFLDETKNGVSVNVGSGEPWDGLVALLVRKNLW